MDHFNKLTPAEAERLALLLEELGEAQQVIGKILRHGYQSTNPTKDHGPTNREMLERELGDIDTAVRLMREADDVDLGRVMVHARNKAVQVYRYLHHQPTDGFVRSGDPA